MARQEVNVGESGLLASMNEDPMNNAHTKRVLTKLAKLGLTVRFNGQTGRWGFVTPEEID
jgi:hypothetical protein